MGEATDRFRRAIEEALGARVTAMARLGGGDVAESYRVSLDDGVTVFAKTHRSPPPQHFSTEARGLQGLRGSGAVRVPEVVAVQDRSDDGVTVALLVLEWVDESGGRPATDDAFGRELAALHRTGAPCFGREDRRSTGSRGLPNEPCATWAEFYATQRLRPLAALARRDGALPAGALAGLERLAGRLQEVGGDPEPPARLHGDLWAGNRLVDRRGHSWLIDPAAHGGHREFDLAMMRLFGGFGPDCFAAYERAHPLAEGWEDRVALHQIAPLVVHAIKFGGGYVATASDAIAQYA